MYKSYSVGKSLELEVSTETTPQQSRTVNITIAGHPKDHFKERRAYGTVILSTEDSRVVKIYNLSFYNGQQCADEEFKKKRAAYKYITETSAREHIAQEIAYGTLAQ
jgi:hypothetical protein